MSFSFCLNKTDLLVLCAMALLYQALELKQDSKMRQDNERLINGVFKMVGRMKAPSTYDLKRVAKLVVSVDEEEQTSAPQQSLPTPPGQSPETVSMAAPPPPPAQKSPPKKPKKKATNPPKTYSVNRHPSMSETDILQQQEKLRRMTMPNISPVTPQQQVTEPSHRPTSRASLDGGRSDATLLQQQRREQRISVSQAAMMGRLDGTPRNLDYLALGSAQPPRQSSPSTFYPMPQQKQNSGMSATEWEALLGQIDGNGVYDTIYGGPQPQQLNLDTAANPVTTGADCSWSPDALDLSAFTLGGDFGASEETLSSVSSGTGDDLGALDFHDFGGLGLHDATGQGQQQQFEGGGGGFGMDGLSVVGDGFGL